MRDKITGFSLIEFSIVLLIIGLLISGTLAGRHISHQAKLSDLAKSINKYLVAINSFKEFYGKYPGDYDEAYSIWGSDCIDQGKCNGDADGNIELILSSGPVNTSDNDESFMAWKHLSLAQMIKGSFTGAFAATTGTDVGVNIPESSFTGAGFSISNSIKYKQFNASSSSSTNFNSLNISRPNSSAAHETPNSDFISARDARLLDVKIDDGIANSGILFGLTNDGSSAWCQNSTTEVDKITNSTNYLSSQTATSCFLVYKIE
jgi:prepilin-type N-terminal cleavage/methylation domain-containing protein